MPKRGRPTSSPDGPKRPYAVKLPADVIAIIRAQPNQAEFLERLVRESREEFLRRTLRRSDDPRDAPPSMCKTKDCNGIIYANGLCYGCW